ncbi:hypothetical protein CK203_035083 [Vitis vinifera]|uniref:Uncharacterized protein n=1 Tax=Vitis vinifera TaxID=29760 RepID=A0A438I9W2_VITVI|nr:hypothetical protein CK203_035083 [Vitis vinifera]
MFGSKRTLIRLQITVERRKTEDPRLAQGGEEVTGGRWKDCLEGCDRVSFRSPFPSPKAFRSTVSPSENPHRRRLFRRSHFPTPTIPSGAQGGDLQVFSKHRRENLIHVRFFSGGLNLTRQRVRARGALSGHALPPPASPNAPFRRPPVTSSPPEPCTCLRKCSSTFPVVSHLFSFTIWSLTAADPRFFFFQPRSEVVLGLSSVQTYFVLQISQGYEDHLVTQEADIPEADRVQWRKIDAQLCGFFYCQCQTTRHGLSTYIGQIASLKEEFLTVMSLTTIVLKGSRRKVVLEPEAQGASKARTLVK